MSLRVLDPGLDARVVDFGRPGTRRLGVPVGGAADRWSLALGNGLVGDAPAAAALEVSLAGPLVRAECDLGCVVFGAPFSLEGPSRKLRAGTTFTLRRGEELHITGTAEGMRAYLCIRGGILGKTILGSRSSLEPVAAGAELLCNPGRLPSRFLRLSPREHQESHTLAVLPGPQAEWYPLEEFIAQEYTISPVSNRMGLRLEGKPLPNLGRELVSEPVCPGAVQVTSNGQCIILGVDGQTIGGYPKIAQVICADLDKLGQLRPGDPIRFRQVAPREAEEHYHARQAELRQWLTRLEAAEWLGAPGQDSR